MGIESEKLVFDYLSRVGDLAHGTAMTAAERARLVGGLRTEIERLRTEAGGADGRTTRKVLDRLGKPEEVVSAALGGATVSAPEPGPVSGPVDGGPRKGAAKARTRRLTKLPQMRRTADSEAEPPPSRGASPPHLAGMDELGPQESDPDWWRVDRSVPHGRSGAPGPRDPRFDIPDAFSGGIELPEVLRRPPGDGEESDDAAPQAVPEAPTAPAAPAAAGDGAAAGSSGRGGSRGAFLGAALAARRRRAAAGPTAGGVVELLAAALLVAGAVLGSLIPLGLGWLAAYWSPRLSRTEGKTAALGIPGITALGAMVWLWGRTEGRWGAPLVAGGDAMQEALAGMWPYVLRVAAVASALYLVWRARRRPQGG